MYDKPALPACRVIAPDGAGQTGQSGERVPTGPGRRRGCGPTGVATGGNPGPQGPIRGQKGGIWLSRFERYALAIAFAQLLVAAVALLVML